MNSKIRIAYITKNLVINGISTVILNYCKNINKEKFQITIIAGTPIADIYYKKFKEIGIKLVEIPSKTDNPGMYYWSLLRELSSKKYDQVHVHGNSATITAELLIAYLKGIKVRFAHSHNTTCNHVRIHCLLKPIFNRLYTYGFACSDMAGKWMFSDRYVVIPNGFDIEMYKFNKEYREKVRKELNVKEYELLIGHVGRFNEQKNQTFLLELFKYIGKINPDSKLLLVGGGPDERKIREFVSKHPYQNRIKIYGESNEIQKLYNAMDIFVFPSRYEGLGIVLLEAQINGLQCVISDVIPKEAYITNNMTSLSLNHINEWIDAISKIDLIKRENSKIDYEKVKQYDIRENVKVLEKYYEKDYTKDGGFI